jgi:DNA polymerase type B, organellar and viral
MIVASLAPAKLAILHRNGWVRVEHNDYTYVVTWARGKWFQVTRYNDATPRITVRIFDIFAFFGCSAIKAWEGMGIDVPAHIRDGKAKRKTFAVEDFDDGTVYRYWSVEIQLYAQLADELRRRVYNAGLRITKWYGPGALATYKMVERQIKSTMAQTSPAIRLAARYAYAGGRFELYKVGRVCRTVYGLDINSAYPHAISQLPSLVDGEWRHVVDPTAISRFGVYRLSILRGSGFDLPPGPVFHRDKDHNISFPWRAEGWYWSPEAIEAQRCGARVIEGWEYVGSTGKPFGWVQEVYDQRRDWKRRHISAQVALKLLLNSMYGKMAQRVGYNEKTKRIPPFHQLEWAGWVTSYVRARLWKMMARQIPWADLIAVETDGIYTTCDPASLNIVDSDELGAWSVTEYDEVMYVQSGLAWLRQGDKWEPKRRGLDEDAFTRKQCERYLQLLHPKPSGRDPWPVYVGQSTRFVTLGQALASKQPTEQRHCVWSTNPRDINPNGQGGKRCHIWRSCQACLSGMSAYEGLHDLAINSIAMGPDPRSYPHSIPWETEVGHAWWRSAEHEHESVSSQESEW